MLTAMLMVLPNPWHTVDHFGRPAGAFPRERHANTLGHQGYVGAVAVTTTPEPRAAGDLRSPEQDTCWQFSKEPVSVPDNKYYRDALRSGELLPGDLKSARAAGLEHREYASLIAAAKIAAEAKWRAAFGESLPAVDPFAKPTPGVLPPESPAAPASFAEKE